MCGRFKFNSVTTHTARNGQQADIFLPNCKINRDIKTLAAKTNPFATNYKRPDVATIDQLEHQSIQPNFTVEEDQLNVEPIKSNLKKLKRQREKAERAMPPPLADDKVEQLHQAPDLLAEKVRRNLEESRNAHVPIASSKYGETDYSQEQSKYYSIVVKLWRKDGKFTASEAKREKFKTFVRTICGAKDGHDHNIRIGDPTLAADSEYEPILRAFLKRRDFIIASHDSDVCSYCEFPHPYYSAHSSGT